MSEVKDKAIEKLEKESGSRPSSTKAGAIFQPVVNALKSFVRQNDEFAQAIVQNDKTVKDCCNEIERHIGSACSDLDVFKMAVNFYFEGATIEFEMKIHMCESEMGTTDKGIVLNLNDFL